MYKYFRAKQYSNWFENIYFTMMKENKRSGYIYCTNSLNYLISTTNYHRLFVFSPGFFLSARISAFSRFYTFVGFISTPFLNFCILPNLTKFCHIFSHISAFWKFFCTFFNRFLVAFPKMTNRFSNLLDFSNFFHLSLQYPLPVLIFHTSS